MHAPTAALGLLLVFGVFSTVSQAREARSAEQFIGAHVDELIVQIGLPARISKMAGGRRAYFWQLEAVREIPADNPKVLVCEVAVTTSQKGRIIRINTKASSMVAGVYASVGAFGHLCARTFGMKMRANASR